MTDMGLAMDNVFLTWRNIGAWVDYSNATTFIGWVVGLGWSVGFASFFLLFLLLIWFWFQHG